MARLLPIACSLCILLSMVVVGGAVQFPVALLLFACAGATRSSTLYAWYCSFSSGVIALWLSFVSLLLEGGYGVAYFIYDAGCGGQDPDMPSPGRTGTILISNHRSRLDWMMLWPVLARAGARGCGVPASALPASPFLAALPALKIVLKDALRWGPLFLGPAIQVGRFLFLARDWEKDEGRATRLYTLLRCGAWGGRVGHPPPPPYALLLFPEGTDLHPAAKDKSAAFAVAGRLPALHCVLQPRVKGLAHALLCLAGTGRGAGGAGAPHDRAVTHVLDMTIAYEGGVPQNEAVLTGLTVATVGHHVAGLSGDVGRMPAGVHVALRKVAVKDIAPCLTGADPTRDLRVVEGEVGAWLQDVFTVKEVALRAFYAMEHQCLRRLAVEATSPLARPPPPDLLSPVLDMGGAAAAVRASTPGDVRGATDLLLAWNGAAHVGSEGSAPPPPPRPAPAGVVLATRPTRAPRPLTTYGMTLALVLLACGSALTAAWTLPRLAAAYVACLVGLLYYAIPLLTGGGLDTLELSTFTRSGE